MEPQLDMFDTWEIWLPRMVMFCAMPCIFVLAQLLFSRKIPKLRSSKFTVCNVMTAVTLAALSLDGNFVYRSPFLVMVVCTAVLWIVYMVGDTVKESLDIKLHWGDKGIIFSSKETSNDTAGNTGSK